MPVDKKLETNLLQENQFEIVLVKLMANLKPY